MLRFAKARQLSYDHPIEIGNEVSKKKFNCCICNDPNSRALGLMGQQLPSGCGCAIGFDSNDYHGLWMKDCLHPLCALFCDEQGVVIDKKLMDHNSPNIVYKPSVPARFVIEVHPSEASSINVGDRVYGS